jgi:CheY-like chemotaxis protein
MKILIVDDDEFNRKILLDILEETAYEVLVAQDGKEGLAMLETHPDTAVVLLDRMMPELDGMGVLSAIAENPKLTHLKVIMQTAANEPKDVIEGNAAGVYYYLTKPFDEELVLSVVESAMNDAKALL